MPTADEVVVKLEARTASYNANIKTANDNFNRLEKTWVDGTGRMRNTYGQFVRGVSAQTSTLTGQLSKVRAEVQRIATSSRGVGGSFGGGLLAGLAGAVSIQGAAQLLDAAARIKNALKVAGLEGEELTRVYDRIFASAQKNAAPVESLVTLYGRLALVQKELGVSSDELLNFTDKIGIALKVSGKSSQEASGALLQLTQALGGGVVRAEEFNSILEGAPAIAQAAARGLTEAGGSVAKLRTLVIDGKISSEAFFRAFIAGSGELETKAQKSEQTISGSFVRLQNVLIDVATRFNESTGATTKFANGINNLLIPAIEELGKIASAVTSGPLAKFYNETSDVLDRLIQGAADFGAATGLDKFGGNPYIGPNRINDRIEGAFANDRAAAGGTSVDAEVRTTPKTDRLNKADAKVDVNVVSKPVSISDYPVKGVGGTADKATELIKSFEGFISKAKYDVNAFRVGFGSDTTTDAAGNVSKVTAATVTSLEDANRDLARRIDQFQAGIKAAIGTDTFASFTAEQQAALTSVAYNYGSLPDRIVKAIATGNPGTVASAIAGLGADNGGVNKKRRMREAELFGGADFSVADFNKPSPSDVFAGDKAKVQERIDRLNAELEAQKGLTAGIKDYGFAADKARIAQDLLNDAKAAGLEITPELAADIDRLAGNYAKASSAAEQFATKQKDAAQAAQEAAEFGKDVLGGFIQDMIDGKSAAEALSGALEKIASKLLDMALNQLFMPQAQGGGGLGGIFQSILGLFGGFKAAGGPVSAGKAYVVGERRPELFVPNTSGRIVPSIPKVGIQSMVKGGQSSGGFINATVTSRYEGGRFVEDMVAISGVVAGKQVKQSNKTMTGRLAQNQARGTTS